MPRSRRAGLGLLASTVVAAAGWRKATLSPSGALGAVAVGTPVFAIGGRRWASVMVGFFTLSSALSRLGTTRKAGLESVAAKGARRDLGQVAANGGVAAAIALAAGMRARRGALFPAYLGALAAAASDTWATEVGMLSRRPPRSIVTLQRVRPGVSGGVTPLGLGAAVAGGAAMGVIGSIPQWRGCQRLVGMAALAGLAGSLADSLLGATVQQIYRCPVCGVETERRVHRCGATTVPARGIPWIDNDVVNLAGTAVGAMTALAISRLGERSAGHAVPCPAEVSDGAS